MTPHNLKLDLVSAESAWPEKVCVTGGKVVHFARRGFLRIITACQRAYIWRDVDFDQEVVTCAKCIAAVREAQQRFRRLDKPTASVEVFVQGKHLREWRPTGKVSDLRNRPDQVAPAEPDE